MIKKTKIAIVYIDEFGNTFESDESESWEEFEDNIKIHKREIEKLRRHI